MTTVAKVAAELLQAYKNILAIKAEHKKNKHEAMLKQFPRNQLFDFEHPYYDMTATVAAAEKQLKQTIKSMLDIEIESGTVRKEYEKMAVMAHLSSKPVDAVVTKLMKL